MMPALKLHLKGLFFPTLLVLLTLALYFPCLSNQFLQWRDPLFTLEHSHVNPGSASHIKMAFQQPIAGIYTPVTVVSFALEHKIWGINPSVSHGFNLLLHMGMVLLIYYLAMQWGISRYFALCAAILFSINPWSVSTVSWVAERSAILAAVFYFAALVSWRKKNWQLMWLILLGLTSPLVVTLPFFIVLVRQTKEPLKLSQIASYWPHFAIALLCASFSRGHLLPIDHLLYLGIALGLIVFASLMQRLYEFLLTQERIILMFFIFALLMLISGLSALSYAQIPIWRNDMSLWKHQVERHPTPMAYCNLATAYRSQDDFRKSQNYYKAYIHVKSEGADASKIKINPRALKQIQTLIDLYKKAIALDKNYMPAYDGLASFYVESGNIPQASHLYKMMLYYDPKYKNAYLGLGYVFQKIGNVQAAVEVYNQLIKLFPDDEDVYIKIIEAYGNAIASNPNKVYQEKREELLASFEQLSKRKHYTATDYYNLAVLYQQVGGKEEAVRFYTKALALQPKYAAALTNLASLYQEAGDVRSALLLYERLVHFFPRNASGYLNMGIILNALGEHDQARQLYQKVISLDPDNGKAYFNLGYLSETEGELKEAINYYEKAIETDPQNAEGYYNLGNVYAALGQGGEAIALYLKTVAINPNHQNAYVNLSILSFKSQDFKGAIKYLEEAQLLGYTPPVAYQKALEPYRKAIPK